MLAVAVPLDKMYRPLRYRTCVHFDVNHIVELMMLQLKCLHGRITFGFQFDIELLRHR